MNIVVLTGAGISAESGISTFRDAGGLWEGHRVEDVASPEGWFKNPSLVLDFYNQRRALLKKVSPNDGHLSLVRLENHFNTTIVTQNVDDLHERAGSSNVIHLHGELKKVRSTGDDSLIYHWEDDVTLQDRCELGFGLRPHIVWFGEAVPELQNAVILASKADIFIIVGTSLQVYPAAGLMRYTPLHCKLYYVDPKPYINHELQHMTHVEVVAKTATAGLPELVNKIIKENT
ncbi:MAG: NAD-dependent deacylase [Saprospiraceae bacterium]